MATPVDSHQRLSINVGPLDGLGSLCFHIAKDLKKFNELYRSGHTPIVEWDLRQVEPGRMNMASLTAFLSFAQRMRQFSTLPPDARVQHKPRVFGFWEDIHFLQLAKELDLFHWIPEHILNDFRSLVGLTNPNSIILSFPEPDQIPDWEGRGTVWIDWKDMTRQDLTDEFLTRCGLIFDIKNQINVSEKQFVEQISCTAAELVLNAHFWGRATVFAGLQRSTRGISVAVCDVGRGFLTTLAERATEENCPVPRNHTEAIIVGSFLNNKEYGLRLAIEQVIDRGGWVTISSYDAEVRWEKPFWDEAKTLIGDDIRKHNDLVKLITELGHKVDRTPSSIDDRRKGYHRTYPHGLRGVRIAFELPF